jgi:hypothetical protein
MNEETTIYFLQKEGVYSHGIFWIGFDLEEGKHQADRAAARDEDDHHGWVLYRYVAPGQDAEYWEYPGSVADSHERVYSASKHAAPYPCLLISKDEEKTIEYKVPYKLYDTLNPNDAGTYYERSHFLEDKGVWVYKEIPE